MTAQVLHVQHPFFAPSASRAGIKYPKKVNVSTQALFQMLQHAVRTQNNHRGVIGTLLGLRSEDGQQIDVKAAYIIPLTEDDSEVTIHVDYHTEMFYLLKRAHPEYQIVGWYSPAPELDNMTGLIHDFYGRENGTFPHPPVHLTVDPESPGVNVASYVSLPIYASPENSNDGNCIFTPVETSVKLSETDQPLTASAAETSNFELANQVSTSVDDAIEDVLEQIDVVLEKIAVARTSNPTPETEALARYLYKVVAASPELEAPNTQAPLKQTGAKFNPRSAMYNSYMRDLVTVANLANSIKRQVQVSSEITSKLN